MVDDEGNHVAGHNQNEVDYHNKSNKDSDSDFNSDGDDELIQTLREQRIAQMKEAHKQKQENMAKGHGKYEEITEEQFLPIVTGTKFVILHFYHNDFERCKIMDSHLEKICRQHIEAKFIRINAEKCPFFVSKLQVQMLPTVVCFIDGIAVDRVIGFEELGGRDDFRTLVLSRRLVKSGVLKAINKQEKGEMKIRRGNRRDSSSDNSVNSDY